MWSHFVQSDCLNCLIAVSKLLVYLPDAVSMLCNENTGNCPFVIISSPQNDWQLSHRPSRGGTSWSMSFSTQTLCWTCLEMAWLRAGGSWKGIFFHEVDEILLTFLLFSVDSKVPLMFSKKAGKSMPSSSTFQSLEVCWQLTLQHDKHFKSEPRTFKMAKWQASVRMTAALGFPATGQMLSTWEGVSC